MRYKKKILAGVLTIAIFVGGIISTPSSSYAAQVNKKEKEEVVYIMTDAGGAVVSVNVVNIYGKGDVTDYGDYSSVKMLTSTDNISQKGDEISFSTDKEKVYYQGTMMNAQIPWDISLTYILNGREVTLKDVAGQSGALEIKISITRNEKCRKPFFDDYALQATFLMDTEKCKNITAAGATTANVGSDKQISYTVLPGKGLNTSINADVTDFEMSAVSISGIKLNLNVEIDDDELMNKVTQIMDAASSLNDGAIILNDGTAKLQNAGSDLTEGTTSLENAVDTLNGGVSTLSDGIISMQNGLNTLNEKSSSLTEGSSKIKNALTTIQSKLQNISISTERLKTLTDSSSAINNAISNLYNGATSLQGSISYDSYKAAMGGNGLDIDTLKEGNGAAITSIADIIGQIETSISLIQEDDPDYDAKVDALNGQIDSLETVATLLGGNNASISGTEAYINALNSGAGDLVSGLAELKTNYDTFDAAIIELANTLSDLASNMSALKEGIEQLVNSYETLDDGIGNYTEGVATIVANYSKLVDGVNNLSEGSKKILDGASTVKDGTEKLYNGIITLSDGSTDMQEGTSEFYNKTSDMDTQVKDQIEKMIESISGDKTEPVSFVSEKNTNIISVQFVIKTDSIKKGCEDQPEAVTVKKSFWEKLLNLFGL